MHPVHYWFIHDLRAYKRALIALAAQVPEATENSTELVENSTEIVGDTYRTAPDNAPRELATLSEEFLEACGYQWHEDLPSRLYLLRNCSKDGLTSQHVARLKKIPEFAIRIPPSLNKVLSNCFKIFMIGLGICTVPVWIPIAFAAFLLHYLGMSIPFLMNLFHWGLTKMLPANQPSSRVLGTEKSPKRLEA